MRITIIERVEKYTYVTKFCKAVEAVGAILDSRSTLLRTFLIPRFASARDKAQSPGFDKGGVGVAFGFVEDSIVDDADNPL